MYASLSFIWGKQKNNYLLLLTGLWKIIYQAEYKYAHIIAQTDNVW